MGFQTARIPWFLFLAALSLALFGQPASESIASPALDSAALPAKRPVYIAGALSDEQQIVFTAALAASTPPALVLFDSPRAAAGNQRFLAAFQPDSIIPVGSFPQGIPELEKRVGKKTAPLLEWTGGSPLSLWKACFSECRCVVVCPSEPRPLLLHSACLAGLLHAPLYVTHDRLEEGIPLKQLLADWHPREVFAAGAAYSLCRELPGVQVIHLANDEVVAACYQDRLLRQGPIRTFVAANPTDVTRGLCPMSSLASLIAVQRHAPLLLTNEKGDNVGDLVSAALKRPGLGQADNLFLVGDLSALPMEHRSNPLAGKDAVIEMEPLTPAGAEPFSFATGRLFHPDPGMTALVLAHQRLLEDSPATRRALVISPSTHLPLVDLLSRYTATELGNTGYQTTTLFGQEADKDRVRGLLPGQDLILWAGHYKPMIHEYLPSWTEPLPPALVFLQSCLALNPLVALPLLDRGAIGVVGSSTRTYAGSGGAFALAYFDALVYDHQSVGGALRQAKNFLLAYSLLKQKRLGRGVQFTGANLRSTWAFTLWGDPTLRLPAPPGPADALPAVRHQVRGQTIILRLPEGPPEQTASEGYQAQVLPNARLAGLLTHDADGDVRHLVPLLFAEVHLPKVPPGQVPRLQSRLPDNHWVFCWDGRRQCGYLLALPRSRDREEIRFHIAWEPAGSPSAAPVAISGAGR